MARKRFNTEEKAIIADGGEVEWQNVTQWHKGRIYLAEIRQDDGWQFVEVINHDDTRTVSAGAMIHVSPGHIRRRPWNAALIAANS